MRNVGGRNEKRKGYGKESKGGSVDKKYVDKRERYRRVKKIIKNVEEDERRGRKDRNGGRSEKRKNRNSGLGK